MRRLRRLAPGSRWFVTVRCTRSEFRLVPAFARTELFKFALAKALERCPGVSLYAVVQMSNHFHLVVRDADSELARLMEYLDGQLARALNRVDRTRGQVFERRYAATEVLDDEALVDRVIYAVVNPVAAGLVETYRAWPGLVAWYGSDSAIPCARFRDREYRGACRVALRVGAPLPDREAFTDRINLVLARPSYGLGDGAFRDAEVSRAIADREGEHLSDRGGRVLGVEAILAADPFDRPVRTKRSRMPLCHASSLPQWLDYRAGWRGFVAAYRDASAAFRRGVLRARFPDYAFRPPLPFAVPIR